MLDGENSWTVIMDGGNYSYFIDGGMRLFCSYWYIIRFYIYVLFSSLSFSI
jgi:hypothetical protein